jgi:RNA polymerase sigma-70 factor (ECF subfamily)
VTRDEILALLRERIVRFAASRLMRDAAEDVAQEVLIILHEKYGHVTKLEELVPLSLQIVRFKVMGMRR